MKKKERRSKTVVVSVTPTELAALKEKFAGTNHRIFAEFVRALLQQEPIVKKVRNQSLDDLHNELISIKNELETARRSFTAAVEHLQTHLPGPAGQEILEFLLAEKFSLTQNMTAIKTLLIQLYEICLQK